MSIDTEYIEEKCNSLEMVTWDRCVLMPEHNHAVVYGWVDAVEEGRFDFVAVQFWFDPPEHVHSFLTSSALWSPTINSILLPDEEHNECQTVQTKLPGLHHKVSRRD